MPSAKEGKTTRCTAKKTLQSIAKHCKAIKGNSGLGTIHYNPLQSHAKRYKAIKGIVDTKHYNPLHSHAKQNKARQSNARQSKVLPNLPEQAVEACGDSTPMLQHHEGDLGRDLLPQLLLGLAIPRTAKDLHVALRLVVTNNTLERHADNRLNLLLLRNREM
jgi:hypothetical protein